MAINAPDTNDVVTMSLHDNTCNDFRSEIDEEWLETLILFGLDFGFDPTSSLSMIECMKHLVSSRSPGNAKDVESLKGDLKSLFVSNTVHAPGWIQSAEWPLHNGIPMLFMGQLDYHYKFNGERSARYYLFIDRRSLHSEVVFQTS